MKIIVSLVSFYVSIHLKKSKIIKKKNQKINEQLIIFRLDSFTL